MMFSEPPPEPDNERRERELSRSEGDAGGCAIVARVRGRATHNGMRVVRGAVLHSSDVLEI